MTGFLRIIALLILAVFAITIIRAVVGIVAKLFTGGAGNSGASPRPGPGNPPKVKAGGTLHRCPVCGTLTSEALAVKRSSGSETVYYCSSECDRRGNSV
ncbi:MAG: hypothetical protein KJZ84_02080 [Bryobacteraceae bacterium]|nr:hypothetical protein [Bryobacteraceae bacterium]